MKTVPETPPLQKEMEAAKDSPHQQALRIVENSPHQQALRLIENSPLQEALRLIENSPHQEALRLIENSPHQQALRLIENSPLQEALRLIESSPHQQALRAMESEPFWRNLRLIEQQQPEILAFQKHVEAIAETYRLPAMLGEFNKLHEQVTALALTPGVAFLPPPDVIRALTGQLAHLVEPYQPAFMGLPAWADKLASQMKALETEWALAERLDQSMIGFAHLSRLSDAVHSVEPYARSISDLMSDELGNVGELNPDASPLARDQAAVEAGLNPELIAFPPASYGRVVVAAGFQFTLPAVPIPQSVDASGDGGIYDPIHHAVLTRVEQGLRQLVEQHMQLAGGNDWIRSRVSGDVSSRWIARRDEERDSGRPVYAPIQYADLIDLLDIIVRKDNWRDAFQPIFLNKDDFAVSLRRLHPVRKALSHSRPLSRADVLTLFSEATRILSALGLKVLSN